MVACHSGVAGTKLSTSQLARHELKEALENSSLSSKCEVEILLQIPYSILHDTKAAYIKQCGKFCAKLVI